MRFIHLADVHLGAVPDKGCPWSSQREEEIWETFRRVIAGIRENPVDFLFIAGDLFHRRPLLRELKEVNYLFSTIPSWETFRRVIAGIRENPVDFLFIAGDLFHRRPLLRELKEVNYLFSTIPRTRVYMIAGNHDYLGGDSPAEEFEWAENVIFFKEERLVCVKDRKLDVYVYGLSYCRREITQPLLENAQPGEGEGLHILLAHGGDESHLPMNISLLSAVGFDYIALGHIHKPAILIRDTAEGLHILLAHGGDESHLPMNISLLSAVGFDYIALGHIHKPAILIRDTAAYSGSLEPVDRNEMGAHGYIEGHIENGRLRTRFVPFASRAYEQIILTLHEDTTQLSLEEMLKEEIYRRGGLNIYRVILRGFRAPELLLVILRGFRAPELLLLPEKLKTMGNIIEVQDESKPAYDLEELLCRYNGTLIGDYIQYFMDKKDRSAVEEKALYYGLQALLETGR